MESEQEQWAKILQVRAGWGRREMRFFSGARRVTLIAKPLPTQSLQPRIFRTDSESERVGLSGRISQLAAAVEGEGGVMVVEVEGGEVASNVGEIGRAHV